MIRTIVTPTQNRCSITLEFPDNYLGKEIEVIAFQKEEGMSKEKPKKTMADFWGIISDETAKEMHDEAIKNRNDWEDRVNNNFNNVPFKF